MKAATVAIGQDAFELADLSVDALPGGCSEPVIHLWGVMLVIELLRSSPAN